MDIGSMAELLAPYGPIGLFCAYLVWRDLKRDERDVKREEREENRRKIDEQIRRDQAEADKEMAQALTLLAVEVKHVRSV